MIAGPHPELMKRGRLLPRADGPVRRSVASSRGGSGTVVAETTRRWASTRPRAKTDAAPPASPSGRSCDRRTAGRGRSGGPTPSTSSAPSRPNSRPGATSCPSPWPTPGPPSCSRASATSTSTPSTSSCPGASDATETPPAHGRTPCRGIHGESDLMLNTVVSAVVTALCAVVMKKLRPICAALRWWHHYRPSWGDAWANRRRQKAALREAEEVARVSLQSYNAASRRILTCAGSKCGPLAPSPYSTRRRPPPSSTSTKAMELSEIGLLGMQTACSGGSLTRAARPSTRCRRSWFGT